MQDKLSIKALKADSIKSKLSSIAYAKDAIKKLRGPTDHRLTKAVRAIVASGLEVRSAYLSGADYLQVRVKSDSLKSKTMVKLLGKLDEILGAQYSNDYVSEYDVERSFKFCNRDISSASLHLDVQLPTDGDACRRVVIGTKMEEVKQYAIECK